MVEEVHPLVVPFLEAREAYVAGDKETIFKEIDLILSQLGPADVNDGPSPTPQTKPKTKKDDKKLSWRLPERGHHFMFMKPRH